MIRRKFCKNNVIIDLNVLYAKKEKKKQSCYVSKYDSNRQKQAILLAIPNGEERERSKTLATRAWSEGPTSAE